MVEQWVLPDKTWLVGNIYEIVRLEVGEKINTMVSNYPERFPSQTTTFSVLCKFDFIIHVFLSNFKTIFIFKKFYMPVLNS